MRRRDFLAAASFAAIGTSQPTLDRRATVTRHNPVLRSLDPRSPLSVGNGEFAFTVDMTGLQTFSEAYDRNMPLCTQSQWGWHSSPIPEGLSPSQLRQEMFETYGRQVGYKTSSKGQEPLFNWLRENPHRLNLGRIGFVIDSARDVTSIEQKLDLWTGIITSRFELKGSPVVVTTSCHPTHDAVAISVQSSLPLSVMFDFPYGTGAMNASDWSSPQKHRTEITRQEKSSLELKRQLDADSYFARVSWEGDASASKTGDHRIVLSGKQFEFVCEFRPQAGGSPLSPKATRKASEDHWARFWSTGGAIDLSNSEDRRAQELERRIVLSQYLTAIQCSGSAPPQETGLTCNSWFGKFHLEMHWWHAAHFPLWGRTPFLERSLGWYSSILPVAREKARSQGYTGARWPKMTDLQGRDSPSGIGELLIWQQPHPISMAELCYRSHPNRATLEKYAEVVMESAEFMASFAVLRDNWYVLGPPLIPAQENHPPRETWNATFELGQWREVLGIAQSWRERLGMRRNPRWDDVRSKLSPLPMKDGVYLAHENCPQTFTQRNYDHPSMLGAYGVLNGEGVDRETMLRTLKRTFRDWRWADTWGWDFPMVAMTAAKLGQPEMTIDALFIESPKNTWLPNGHNWQRASLPCYLPGNGGLLAAVAMMAAKWEGFPKQKWSVRSEGLQPLL